jgi:transglutaminase-like putative cysteine protease
VGTGALSLITLFISVAVFLAFPRVTRGWAQGGPVFATRIAGFADEISLGDHGATIRSNPEVVLRVEFPDGRPANLAGLHWRGRSYDRFDGVRWVHSADLPGRENALGRYRGWTGPRIRQEIYGSLLDSRVLFALHPLVDVDAHSRIRPYVDRAGDVRYFGSVAPRYEAESIAEPPTPEAMADPYRGGSRDPAPARRFYLQLPPLSPRVAALADSLTAGRETRADSARAIEAWLRGLEYTRDLPATAAQTGIEYFLFQRRAGHCEYFSTAMVVLLRSVGIPSRNVNGFLGGQWNGVGGHLAVTQNEAHSWVEVWHPGFGWVTYDPTPAGGPGVAAADEPWFWPGRVLLDGLRHRWSKWVLDYDLANQEGLLRRAAQALDRTPEGGGRDEGSGLPGWLLWLAVALGVVGVAWVARSSRRSRPPETRLYLRLRRAYAGRGFDHIPRAAPLEFAAAVEQAGGPGAREAGEVARRYVRLRFGPSPPSPGQLEAMRAGLRTARRALRRR